MNKIHITSVLTILLLLLPQVLLGQTVYTGFVGKYPIELITQERYSDGLVRAIYTYTKFDTPISIDGELKGSVLNLYEKNNNGEVTATLVFEKFSKDSEILNGKWRNEETAQQSNIQLRKVPGKELTQRESLKNYYFKAQLLETGDNIFGPIKVRIIEKQTDKLVQEFSFEAQFRGVDSIAIGDYNFDGMDDFSVFQASHAGPNTSSLYFLYNPKTRHFFESDFSNLAFNSLAVSCGFFPTFPCLA